MISDETDGTAEFCVVRKQGDYVLIAVTPKGRERESYYVSVGGAEVLLAELQGAMSSAQPSADGETTMLDPRMIELLPCPFCAETSNFAHADDGSIECGSCYAYGPTPACGKGDWNTRAMNAVSQPPADVVEAAKRILAELDEATRKGRFSSIEEADMKIVALAALNTLPGQAK